jgi:hypothetical protein
MVIREYRGNVNQSKELTCLSVGVVSFCVVCGMILPLQIFRFPRSTHIRAVYFGYFRVRWCTIFNISE